jgi:RHS repeat-associated protein
MRLVVRGVAICLLFCVALGCLGAGVSQAASGAAGAGSSVLVADPFVIEGSPEEAQQAQAAEEAKLASPEAVAEREASSTKYENLNTEQSEKVAGEAFPAVVDTPAGGPPKLAAGQSITGYPTDNTAQLNLSEGKRGLFESTEPIAFETSPGQRTPVNLGLGEGGRAFEPKTPVVAVRIPKRLAEGVQLAAIGVSLTPVDAHGTPLGGSEGALDGASVFYANTQSDTDGLVKPTTAGFEADTVLRSVASPEQLAYRVGLPEGASLVQAEGSGIVRIVKEGTTLATIGAPTARDAAGTSVPVSMSLSGATLTIAVAHRAGEYEYPILVDPTVHDYGFTTPWVFATSDPSEIKFNSHNNYIEGSESAPIGEWAIEQYPTQGASRIYEAEFGTDIERAKHNRNSVYIENPSKRIESNGGSITEAINGTSTLCVESGCSVPSVTAEGKSNTANFETMVKERETGGWEVTPFNGDTGVYIVQETGPTFGSFNTSTETTSTGLLNGLYGHKWEATNSARWGVEASATDPGLGIRRAFWKSPNAPKWGTGEFLFESEVPGCKDDQCEESVSPTYSLKDERAEGEQLPDGEDTIEVKVEDSVGLTATGVSAKIKVDNTPPHSITLEGLPSTHEISDGQHISLKASAEDGTAGHPSSGVASIRLTMDGQEVGTPSKGCPEGPCKATGEWTLSGENYAAGEYTLDVIATDNAGNVATEVSHVTIHHAGGVGVGPGSVNPVTGELSLSASDVSISTPGAPLTVSRSYRSRHLALGTEGPLGPQWSLSLGAQASLVRTPGGGMVLMNSNGTQTVFESSGSGKFKSPAGDAAYTLSETSVGGKTEFLLSNNGAVTTFALPAGSSGSVWTPAVNEGAGGVDVTSFAYRLENGVVEPTEELAPVPAGVSCSPTLTKGCRALKFEYAGKETKAPGEGPGEWGEFAGHLSKITYTAWNPSSKEMATVVVAQYAYDGKGRLRAEWDTKIEPSLKTIYGYDSEGHVTAVSGPGQQPVLLEQGTVPGDSATGRLLAVDRPAAVTTSELKEEMAEPAPTLKTAPALSSTTPKVGVKINVELTSENTPGQWNYKPLAYSYQWQDCNAKGEECTAIPGAVNQAYYPVASDEGHKLVAQVVALNATGAVTASSAATTSTVAAGTPNTPLPEPPSVGSSSVTTIDYQVPLSGSEPGLPKMSSTEVAKWGQTDVPAEAMAVFPPDKPMGWPAKEYTRATITYIDAKDRAVNVAGPTGGVSTTEYNLYSDVVRTLSPDDRATALKETCESSESCKSAEVAKELDSESTYEEKGSEPGTELLSTLGPMHNVESTTGTQAEGRDHSVYKYNEGAPSEGGPYRLVTKLTEGAVIGGTEESASVRTTTTSYSGQENLGWTLRAPTSVTTDPSGLDLTHTTFYEPLTGNVTETRTPAGGSSGTPSGGFEYLMHISKVTCVAGPDSFAYDSSGDVWMVDTGSDQVLEFSAAGKLLTHFGSEGTGNVQFKEPRGIAIDSEGHIWVADTGNNRIQEISNKGVFVRAFGKEGSENGEFKKPVALAINSEGKVWVADNGNDRLQEFTSTGTYVTKVSLLGKPEGVTLDSKGDVWVTAENLVWEFSASGEKSLGYFGGKGTENGKFTEAAGLAVTGENVYVVDRGNSRVQKFKFTEKEGKMTAEYLTQVGKKGSGNSQFQEPQDVGVDKEGHIWVADAGNNRLQEFGSSKLEYLSQFATVTETCKTLPMTSPDGVAVDPSSNVWVADTGNNRVDEFSSAGKFLTRFGIAGSGNGQFKEPRGIAVSREHVWVADTANNRVEEFSTTGEFTRAFGTEGTEEQKLRKPRGIAVTSEGDVWVTSAAELERGQRVDEFSSTGTFIRSVELASEPEGIATDTKEDVWVTAGSDVWEYSKTGVKLGEFGGLGSGNGQLKEPAGLAVTTKTVYVADRGNSRVEEFQYTEKEGKMTAEYVSQVGSKGTGNSQFKEAQGAAVDSEGHLWVADGEPTLGEISYGNERITEFKPVLPGPHSTQTIYYSAGANYYAACGERPEWANLPCQTQPTVQPEGSLPKLPVTTTTYNVWDEPEKEAETVGAVTRTKTVTYDAVGRVLTTAISCAEAGEKACPTSDGKAMPTVTNEYNSETGSLEKLSTTVEGKTKTLTSKYNTLGQLVSYTDAAAKASTASYEYDVDGRMHKTNDGKGTQTYSYSATAGLLSELVDSSHEGMKFTATYDVEGNMLSEGYPNGMTATYTYSAVGKPTAVVYKKTTHCTEEAEKCVWFKDVVLPSIHGQWLEQTSGLSHQAYTYDAAGRLTQVQNTPTASKDCTTRLYSYEADSNRTSLTTREPGTEKCATEGGVEEKHTYDTADRLTDTGTQYNEFGDTLALPAKDAGGTEAAEDLTSTYYLDNQVATQSQNGETLSYELDPSGRTLETDGTGKKEANTTLHYAGPTDSPAWMENSTGETSRNIPGINGQLVAIQYGTEAPVLQVTNLHGDIVATASVSETATELTSKVDTSEFGVPTTSLPPKYSWLGALEVPSELASGVVNMGARSYVPQIGRFLQPDPVPGGSANAYAYTFGDPVNTSDPSGEYTASFQGFVVEGAEQRKAAQFAEIRSREEAEARAAAEQLAAYWAAANAALEAQYRAEAAAGPQYTSEAEEGEEAEYTEVEVSSHPGEGNQPAPFVEEGTLFQPANGSERTTGLLVCKPHATTPCTRRILRFHWHWWGVSIALSRNDMNHLSEALGVIATIGAKKLIWEVAAGLGVASVGTAVLAEHNICLTFWVNWVPGQHGQVSDGPVSGGLYQCYG